MPGPNYSREFGYNEESQLLSISHSGTLAYQYAYGADGNRRWAKEIANNAWTWYPCGVACGAGELVEQGRDLTGATWTTNAQYLRAGGGCRRRLIRRKSSPDDEYHHMDITGTAGMISDQNVAIVGDNSYDAFGVRRYSQLHADTPYRFLAACGPCKLHIVEGGSGLTLSLLGRAILISERSLLADKKKDELPGCNLYNAHKNDGGAAADCQDCCDDHLVELLKERFKDKSKELLKCPGKCLGKTNHDGMDCAKECLTDAGNGIINIQVDQYTKCCYKRCVESPGTFNPPGSCKLTTAPERLAQWRFN